MFKRQLKTHQFPCCALSRASAAAAILALISSALAGALPLAPPTFWPAPWAPCIAATLQGAQQGRIGLVEEGVGNRRLVLQQKQRTRAKLGTATLCSRKRVAKSIYGT